MGSYLRLCVEFNSWWIKVLNIMAGTMKLQEDNVGKTSSYFSGQWFLGYGPKSTDDKPKIDKCNYTNLKTFLLHWGKKSTVKRQPIAWEKIFANALLHEGSLLNIFSKSYTSTKQIQQTNGQQTGTDSSVKKIHTWPNKPLKRCLMPLTIREMPIKITMTYHFISLNRYHCPR